jgi:hypothetical protein
MTRMPVSHGFSSVVGVAAQEPVDGLGEEIPFCKAWLFAPTATSPVDLDLE